MAIGHDTGRERPCCLVLRVTPAVHARAQDILQRYEAEAGRCGADLAAADLVLDEWVSLLSWAGRDAWESRDYAGWLWSPWWRRRQVWAALDPREYVAGLWRWWRRRAAL